MKEGGEGDLSGLLGLGSSSLYETSALLLEEHDVESIKVGEVPPLFGRLALLSPRRLVPLCDNLGSVEHLLDGRSTRGRGSFLRT